MQSMIQLFLNPRLYNDYTTLLQQYLTTPRETTPKPKIDDEQDEKVYLRRQGYVPNSKKYPLVPFMKGQLASLANGTLTLEQNIQTIPFLPMRSFLNNRGPRTNNNNNNNNNNKTNKSTDSKTQVEEVEEVVWETAVAQ
eukprot:UN10751